MRPQPQPPSTCEPFKLQLLHGSLRCQVSCLNLWLHTSSPNSYTPHQRRPRPAHCRTSTTYTQPPLFASIWSSEKVCGVLLCFSSLRLKRCCLFESFWVLDDGCRYLQPATDSCRLSNHKTLPHPNLALVASFLPI